MNATDKLIDLVIKNKCIDDSSYSLNYILYYIYNDTIDKNLLLVKLKEINSGISYFALGCVYDKYKDHVMSIYYLNKSHILGFKNADPTIYRIISDMGYMSLSTLIRECIDNKEELQLKYDKIEEYTTHLLTKPDGDDYKKAKDRFETKNYDL